MELELIGFKICPFVQRVNILLQFKKLPCVISYLNPKELPAWLETLSPLGKVPLLKVGTAEGKGAVVFESQVINEFIDETHAPVLMPADPLERARQRGLVAVADGLLGGLWNWVIAKDTESVESARAALCKTLRFLESELPEQGAFFVRSGFGLVDCAMLPFFMRLGVLEAAGAAALPCGELQRVADYRGALASLPVGRASVVPEFDALYLGFVKAQGGVLSETLE
jgi:glutathione S-transferase